MVEAVIRIPGSGGVGLHIKVRGPQHVAGGARVVVDQEYSDDARERITATIDGLLAEAHPTLLRPLREVVVPNCRHPHGVIAGSGAPAYGQVVFWDPPATFLASTLDHELAHLMHADSGPPDRAAWEAAIHADTDHADQNGLPGHLRVDVVVAEAYPEPELQTIEDWAYSIQYALADDRAAAYGESWWRAAHPHRAAIIDRVLEAA